jgi:hypothetical protein
MSCNVIDKCSDKDIDGYDFFFKIVTSKSICSIGDSAGGSARNGTIGITDSSFTESGSNENGSAGGVIKNEVGSGKAFSAVAAGVGAAAVVFAVLL